MPYRRLPNTDSARLKALRVALEKGKNLPPFKLSYSQKSLQLVRALLPGYENALTEHKTSYQLQLEKSKEFNKSMKKVRLYISHFIQVINMAIIRGELPQNTRNYFRLEADEKKLPALNSEEEILDWSNKLISGEQSRRMKGLSPITNPTIAIVNIQYDKFIEASVNFQSLKKRHHRAQENLNARRAEADSIIQQLWNEVEEKYSDLPENLKREKASDYGITYVFRKNEISNSGLLNMAQISFG
ncbi:MAG: hypothetical protein K9H49_05310 [Bacteroidales bacterium]|nr:hypothetical protein [Bacteroidales bacterium]MCF8391323.1 hypothetical protein [Bacteroidales bacterium]